MQRSFIPFFGLIALLAGGSAAQAAPLENLDALERRLVIALGADIGQPGGPVAPIDRRMRLASCPAPAEVEPPYAGAAVLRCAPVGWRIRVPVLPGGMVRMASAAQPRTIVRAVRDEPVIRRGDPVEIRTAYAGFTVTKRMIAEQDGAPGERIRVRTEPRTRPMVVEVVDVGLARIPGI